MKSIYKLTSAILAFTMVFVTSILKAQDSQNEKIGLTVGLDYVSNYIYRGTYYYLGDITNGGLFSPYVSYNLFNTGLTASVKGEIVETWIWGEKDEQTYASRLNSIDFNINYMYNLKDSVTFNLGSWYYRLKTIQDVPSYNPSFFDLYFSATIDAFPLTPMLAITYSYFTDKDYACGPNGNFKNGDFYIQLGISHSFELDDETYFDLAAIAGWYDKNAYDFRVVKANKNNSADISDIDLSAGLTTIVGTLTLSTSFHYVIIPGTQYKETRYEGGCIDRHKFYAKFGVSCSI